MKNIHVNYISGSVDLNSVITNAVTSTAYNGSSFYLLGRLDSEKLSVSLTGEVFRGPFRDTVNSNDFCPPNCERSITLKRSGEAIITNRRSIGYFLERMWVHKTIEKFENLLNEDPKNADELRNRIRSLSLRHSLLTSETAICIEINGENMEIEQSNEINEDYSKVRPPEIQSVKFYKNAGFSFPRYVLSFLFIQLLILIYLYVSKVHRGSSDTGDNDLFLRTNNA
ncbi:hypothetical protein AB6A40_002984 [Gnathostoma spinigerum]|uniref:Uncharacterized protein n=1 Tax=Gnathostoma spinigerum TaxID=75299 RepID=A0ABD6EJ09_9BILA